MRELLTPHVKDDQGAIAYCSMLFQTFPCALLQALFSVPDNTGE